MLDSLHLGRACFAVAEEGNRDPSWGITAFVERNNRNTLLRGPYQGR